MYLEVSTRMISTLESCSRRIYSSQITYFHDAVRPYFTMPDIDFKLLIWQETRFIICPEISYCSRRRIYDPILNRVYLHYLNWAFVNNFWNLCAASSAFCNSIVLNAINFSEQKLDMPVEISRF